MLTAMIFLIGNYKARMIFDRIGETAGGSRTWQGPSVERGDL